MRKENSLDFVSLLQNDAFINLVKDTNGIRNQLDVIEREFPGQREAIAFAVEFLKANLSDQKNMHSDDVATILLNIKKHAGQSKSVTFHRFISYEIWKVAAVLIIILASSIYTYQRLNRDSLGRLASIETIGENDAMIILSDGSKHKLSPNDSHIEYSADGGEVYIKNDKQKEKIENFNTSITNPINQIIVPFGRRHIIILSDGTRVQLNSGSRLEFPAKFSDKNREVYLKGEGCFEVSKNPDKPFIVKTDFIDIKVLGTVFNISAYEDEQIASAVLVEGKIVVSQKTKLLGTTEEKLNPGQGYFYSSSTLTSDIRNVDVYDYISWKDGLFLFKDQPLINIVNRVEKYYNKKILIEGGKLPKTLISGKLVLSDNIDEVMQYLAKTLEARYEKNEEGTFLIKN